MADCSVQEPAENSAADSNADMEMTEAATFDNCDGDVEHNKHSEDSHPVMDSDLSLCPEFGNDAPKKEIEHESAESGEECDDPPSSVPAEDNIVAKETDVNTAESGEVSDEEYNSGASSPTKTFPSVHSANPDDHENQDEFFEDDRSQTPLQDEQDTELCTKGSELYLNPDDASSEYQSVGVRINEMVSSEQQEQNTDGELSDDDKMIPALAGDGVPLVEKPSSNRTDDNSERKPAVSDDYGELDYEEEDADDSIDNGKTGGEKKKKEKTNKESSVKNDLSNQDEGEEGEEPEDGEVVTKAKDRKAEKKTSKEELEEGEEQEEGEHSTDGELDDDDDCEDGEIREPGLKHAFVRPMCRFYTRGNCTWGSNCRFLHPGVNDKGNYSMIDQPFPPGPPGMMGPMGPGNRGPPPPPPAPGPWIHDRLGKRVMPRRPEMDAEVPLPSTPLPPPPTVAEVPTESAWERGLRHAKEIRKMAKKKEMHPNFEEKKESDAEEEREPVPPPPAPPAVTVPVPPSRDPYYDDLPVNRYDEDTFYNRPPLPLPPPEVWPFRPPPLDPFEMRWPRGPLDFPPLPPPDFRLAERERALRDRRFSPPPRFEPGRPLDERFNRYDKFNRYDRYYRDGPPREPLPPPPTDRGRGEEWKDPWLRSRSPKRKRASSSHSGSRGRRKSRSRSKDSYSSFSSSSYSSKSRSRSRSSSYSSSYSKSSRSRSSYSSRSSSRSRSRSSSTRKPLPVATTLGQSILEKHGKAGDGPKSVVNKVLPLAIGSVPLPPTEKIPAPAVSQVAKAVTPSAAASLIRPPAVTQPELVKTPPVSSLATTKLPGVAAPIGAKPIVVPGRPAPLQPVGRGVAAAFSDKDDEPYEPPGANSRAQLPPLSQSLASDKTLPTCPPPVFSAADKGRLPLSSERGSSSVAERGMPSRQIQEGDRVRNRGEQATSAGAGLRGMTASQQPPSSDKLSVRASQPPIGKDSLKASQQGPSVDRGSLRSQANDGERASVRALASTERTSVKVPPPTSVSERDRGNARGMPHMSSSQPIGKSSSRPGEGIGGRAVIDARRPGEGVGGRAVIDARRPGEGVGGRAVIDARSGMVPADRNKMDQTVKRRDRMHSSSTESSRSRSRSTSRSISASSSASHDSEHLYSDIASPISSASSISPARSPIPKLRQAEKGRVPIGKTPPGRLASMSSSQHLSQRPDNYRGELRDRAPTQPPPPSRVSQSLQPHVPSRSGGSREIGREAGGRSGGSFGSVHPRDMAASDSRMRSSAPSSRAPQSHPTSSRAGDPHTSQKGNIKLTLKSDKVSSQVSAPSPPMASSRKRPASPIGRLSPPSKIMRRTIEPKEPVKIPIPRHDKVTKPGPSPPPRRRLDSGHLPPASPVGKAPNKTTSKGQSALNTSSGGGGSGGGSSTKRKGALSRREELLMQLQAVEDAIAKKRSKMQ